MPQQTSPPIAGQTIYKTNLHSNKKPILIPAYVQHVFTRDNNKGWYATLIAASPNDATSHNIPDTVNNHTWQIIYYPTATEAIAAAIIKQIQTVEKQHANLRKQEARLNYLYTLLPHAKELDRILAKSP